MGNRLIANPFRAHVVEKPEEWKWSSCRAAAGIDAPPEFLTTEWLLSQFGNQKKRAEDRRRKFVIEGIAGESLWKEQNSSAKDSSLRLKETAASMRPTSGGVIPSRKSATISTSIHYAPASRALKRIIEKRKGKVWLQELIII